MQTSRPRWALGDASTVSFDFNVDSENFAASYRLPAIVGQTAEVEYSVDLQTWFENPPGLYGSRSITSQGELLGAWHLPMDSLLPRSQDKLFLRAKIE